MKTMQPAVQSLRAQIVQPKLAFAPVVFNAMTALMAEGAAFDAAYVGGASLGYLRGCTEAALTPHDFVQVGLEIRAACALPLIMDGGCGWGDPVHMRRNISLAETSGYSAIEIEDQVVPKRAHHHIGIEHLLSVDDMAAKIQEATRARNHADFLIIARTNAVRENMDDALRRCDAYARAGADMLFPVASRPEDLRTLGERSPLPLMLMVHPGNSFTDLGLSHEDLISLQYRLIVDGLTPFAEMYAALARSYASLHNAPPHAGILAAMAAANELVGLAGLLEIERRTTERNSAESAPS